MFCFSLVRGIVDGDDNDHDDEKDDEHQKGHELDILPPHLPLEPPAADAELAGAAAQPVRLVHEEVHPLAALEQALDVLRHDAADVVDLAARVADGVVAAARCRAVLHHERLELAVEGAGAVVGHVGKVRQADGESAEEALADLEEEAEGHAAAEGGVGDDEEGEAAGRETGAGVVRGRVGNVVDLVVAVGVGELLRGAVLDLGEDEGGERRGLGRGRGDALGEDGRAVGDAGAEGRNRISFVSYFDLRQEKIKESNAIVERGSHHYILEEGSFR